MELIFALLSLLAPKKVTKKRHPLPGPVKRDSLVIGFFAVGVTNSSRSVGTQTCVAFATKKPITAARSRWGPNFPRSPLGTNLRPHLLDVGNYSTGELLWIL